MGNIQLLASIFRRIGNFSGKMEPFKERLIFQKTIYLLQTFDLNLGYRFSWYIHGPYCTELTKDGYELVGKFDDISEVKFDRELEQKLVHLMKFLGDNKSNADWLEVVTSIHVLKKIYPEMAKEQIIKAVMKKQPDCFTEKMCYEAWAYLEKYELI